MPLSEPFLGKPFLSSQISDRGSLEWHLKRARFVFFLMFTNQGSSMAVLPSARLHQTSEKTCGPDSDLV